MKIYTRTGDTGETSLLFGERVAKNDPRVDAYGTVDEANSALGLGLSLLPARVEFEALRAELLEIQRILFHVGAELATPQGRRPGWELLDAHVAALEPAIDAMEAQLPLLKSFVLPGGSSAGATLHLARSVVRRAERAAVGLPIEGAAHARVVKYLNRLSDYLFVAARLVNHVLATPETPGPAPKALANRPDA